MVSPNRSGKGSGTLFKEGCCVSHEEGAEGESAIFQHSGCPGRNSRADTLGLGGEAGSPRIKSAKKANSGRAKTKL
jgi:hypothetical protein